MKLFFLSLLFLMLNNVTIAGVIDQANVNAQGSVAGYTGDYPHEWIQEVTVGIGGQLESIELSSFKATEVSGELLIYSAWGDLNSEIGRVSYADLVVVDKWFSIDVTSLNLFYSVDDVFSFGIRNYPVMVPGVVIPYANLRADANALYSRGRLGYALPPPFDPFYNSSFDLVFTTHMSVVPEPSAIALMGLGLLGFAVSRRKYKKN